MSRATLKDISRVNYTADDANFSESNMQIGCLQRIATATEAIAKNYVQLQKDMEFWRQEYYHEKNRREAYQRSIVAHKANYTRLKNKIEAGVYINDFCKENDLCPICITGGWNCGSDHK